MMWAAANPPLCTGSFSSFLMVLMERSLSSHLASIFPYPSLLNSTGITSMSTLPQMCHTCCHELPSSSTHLLRSLLHVCRTDQTKTGCPYICVPTVCQAQLPHTGWQQWARQTRICALEAYALVQIVCQLVQLSLYLPDQTESLIYFVFSPLHRVPDTQQSLNRYLVNAWFSKSVPLFPH